MAKRCTKRRSLRNHRRTRRGGDGVGPFQGVGHGGGRKKMMRTHRRTRRGGVRGVGGVGPGGGGWGW